MLKKTPTPIQGCYIIELHSHNDKRGDFTKLYSDKCVRKLFPEFTGIQQVNFSENYNLGTIRGMHLQLPPHAENKIVSCLSGRIFDVVVDLRPTSKTYCKTFSIELSAKLRRSIFIPKGCAHGFQALEDRSSMVYLHDNEYYNDLQFGCRYNDPKFAIEWPLPTSTISDRDINYKLYGEQS